jgi:putative flippase GtrA
MKFIKYFFVGGIAALVDFLIFALFVKILKIPWFISGVTGFVLATLVNYLLSIRHVFTSGARFKKHKEIILIFFVSFIGLIINQLILWQCIEFLFLEPLFAKIIATGIVFFWNYSARNHFIFKVNKNSVSSVSNQPFTAEVPGGAATRSVLAIVLALVVAVSIYVYECYTNDSPIWSDGNIAALDRIRHLITVR